MVNKANKIVFIFSAVAVVFIIILAAFYIQKQKEIVLFYSETCPHCKIVENFMEINKLNETLKIINLEVSKNQTNAVKFEKVLSLCKINPDSAGVPLAYTGGNCYIGDTPIIELFKSKSGITTASVGGYS